MGQIIKRFNDGSFLEYDRGNFDDWCVYLTKPNSTRIPPRDADCFHKLKELATLYGNERIYGDYVKVYDLTQNAIELETLNKISDIANSYDENALEFDIVISVLYTAMIAEQNKSNTRLGKRIKRLGVHKLLIEGCSVHDAANFMRGMTWQDIDVLCGQRGF